MRLAGADPQAAISGMDGRTGRSHYLIGEPRPPSCDELRALVPDIADRHVYVCGPTDMTSATRATLRRYCVPAAQITTERFSL